MFSVVPVVLVVLVVLAVLVVLGVLTALGVLVILYMTFSYTYLRFLTIISKNPGNS
jgi:hypothetical protein